MSSVKRPRRARPAEAGRTRPRSPPIVARTLADRAFEVLRERVVNGDLASGPSIRQDALAAELGVSKIPLREALARLEQEGLLRSEANRGYFVQPISPAHVDEIYDLRLRIEPPAAARGALEADEHDREHVRWIFGQLDAPADGKLAGAAMRNREFHAALVSPAKRALTTQLVERLLVQSERYVIAHLRPSGRGSRAHREHREILEAWLARDAKRVERLLTHHIEATRDDLEVQLAGSR